MLQDAHDAAVHSGSLMGSALHRWNGYTSFLTTGAGSWGETSDTCGAPGSYLYSNGGDFCAHQLSRLPHRSQLCPWHCKCQNLHYMWEYTKSTDVKSCQATVCRTQLPRQFVLCVVRACLSGHGLSAKARIWLLEADRKNMRYLGNEAGQ